MTSEELPEGWTEAALGTFIESMANGVYKPEKYYSDDGVACLRMYNIQGGRIQWQNVKRMRLTPTELRQYQLLPGDILVNRVNSRELVGKAAICDGFPEPTVFESKNIRLRLKSEAVDPNYVNYLLLANDYRLNLSDGSKQTVGMATVSQPQLAALLLPFPPHPEQRRIVVKIEELLSRVDAARARLAKVPAILKRFRQSVLAAACSGRLTADAAGRRRSSGAPETWELVQFDDVCDDITVGHVGPMAKEYVDSGIPFLRSQNVREFRFEPIGLKFITRVFHQKLKKSALEPGDVAIVRSGNAGVACVIPDMLPEANCADLVIVRPGARLNPHYAAIFLNSTAARMHVDAEKVGIAQGHFNIGSMRETSLPLPPLLDQQEIVGRVEALFRLADAIEKRVTAATARAQKVTQAILAKAFRGELVPTEAELARREGRPYEPASQLLERIRREQLESSDGSGRIRSRRSARQTKQPQGHPQ
jgi:type I restriction enzyme S subunit